MGHSSVALLVGAVLPIKKSKTASFYAIHDPTKTTAKPQTLIISTAEQYP